MKTFFLILTVVLWVVVRSAAAKAKRSEQSEDAASKPSQPSYSSVRSAFESLFDDEETQEEAPASASFSQEEAQAGYYSYETVDEPEAQPMSYQTQQPPSPSAAQDVTPVPTAEPEPVLQDFDLRQAVVYQTILSNKYLDEIHAADN